MATNKAVAAAFAAGLAAGTGGTATVQQEQIDAAQARADAAVAVMDKIDAHNPTIKAYVRNAATEAITGVLDDKARTVRAVQLGQLVDDIEADTTDTETAMLSDLPTVLAGKVRVDDPAWQVWYAQNFAVHLKAQVQTGTAVGNLTYSQIVRLRDVTNAMRAVAVLHTPEVPGEAIRSMETVRESLAEVARGMDEARARR